MAGVRWAQVEGGDERSPRWRRSGPTMQAHPRRRRRRRQRHEACGEEEALRRGGQEALRRGRPEITQTAAIKDPGPAVDGADEIGPIWMERHPTRPEELIIKEISARRTAAVMPRASSSANARDAEVHRSARGQLGRRASSCTARCILLRVDDLAVTGCRWRNGSCCCACAGTTGPSKVGWSGTGRADRTSSGTAASRLLLPTRYFEDVFALERDCCPTSTTATCCSRTST